MKLYAAPMNKGTKASEALEENHDSGNQWLGSYLPYQIYRVSSLMNMRLQGRLRASGINLSQWRVLSVLRSMGRLNMTQIVDQTLMEQPTVSRVVAQLEQEKFVERRTSLEDSRVAEIGLTAKGVEMFDDIAPSAVRHQRTAMEGLANEDLQIMRSLLEQIEKISRSIVERSGNARS